MSSVLVEKQGAVVTWTINRPQSFNALDSDVLAALRHALDAAVADSSVRAVIVTGAGDKAFSAGADLKEIAEMTRPRALAVLSLGQEVLRSIERAPVPVIAAVNGLALGGGFELALAATVPVLSANASLGLPEAGLGLIPGYGGTQRLPRAVGARVAAHLMLTGGRLSAERAHELDLAPLPPVPGPELLPTARLVADQIADQGPRAARSILHALDMGRDAPLDAGLALETQLAADAIAGDESTEGVEAFLKRRRAVFPDIEDRHGH